MFRVTIRAIETNEDDQLPVTFSLGTPADCLIVSDSRSPDHRLAVAQAWAKAVGLARRSFLSNQLGARQGIIDACTSVRGVLDSQELTPAPRFLCPADGEETTHWLLDNLVESWLISVTSLPVHAKSW
jgi:hypothetical protein